MSGFLTASLICFLLSIALSVFKIVVNAIYGKRYSKYKKEYFNLHNPYPDKQANELTKEEKTEIEEVRSQSYHYGWKKADEFCFARFKDNAVMIILAGILAISAFAFFKQASNHSTAKLNALFVDRRIMAQNAAITGHLPNATDIDAFNLKVVLAYKNIPNVDKKLFFEDTVKLVDTLIIPYDDEWYNAEAVKES